MKREKIHIFYACDENFLKYTTVSIVSLMENASKEYFYHIHIMHSGIKEEAKKLIQSLENTNFKIEFDDVTAYLLSLKDKLPIRDYFTMTTYYRIFIAEMYPGVKKAIYIDSDTVIQGDISELYREDIGNYYLAACVEQVMVQTEVFGNYVERVLGISRNKYFNAGIMLINCKKFRKEFVLEQFAELLETYNFIVTQDEDYLNVICKGKVKYLHPKWNVQTYGTPPCKMEESAVIHYIMQNKPWHFSDCMYEEVFWKYAKRTTCYEDILREREAYTDEQRENDARAKIKLAETAQAEIDSDSNYLKSVVRPRLAPDRVAVQDKILQYEREGRFDEDVEEDPPAPVLMPDKIEYIRMDPLSKIKTGFTFLAAHIFVYNQMWKKKLIIKEIKGIEHFRNLDSGAIITCNHFNAYDSFAIHLAYKASKQRKRRFYRVIREGNYTNFPGFYGMLMRNCYTLPLSSNNRTMRKFLRAVDELLQKGHFILFYPEQSMWWNYRKPKPLKSGAFSMAAKNGVPVLPCFITMQDSNILGEDGYYVQEYTIHVSEPIYPEKEVNYRENMQTMMDRNYVVWKEIYEKEYGIPLVYSGNQAIERKKGELVD